MAANTLLELCLALYVGRVYERLENSEQIIVDWMIRENHVILVEEHSFNDRVYHGIEEVTPVSE